MIHDYIFDHRILSICSCCVLTIYIIVVLIKFRSIPPSISETYYRLKHKAFFGWTMFISAISLMPVIIDISEETYQIFAFLACAGVALIGTSPKFKDERLESKVHEIGAIALLVSSQTWVALTNPLLHLFWVPIVVYVIISLVKRKTKHVSLRTQFSKIKLLFYVEVVAIVTTYSSVFLILSRSPSI